MPGLSGRCRFLDGGALPPVAILYAHANIDAALVTAMVAHGVQGSVLAGMGNGNASRAHARRPAGAAHRSMAVVRATRIGEGLIERVVGDLDVALGFLVARDLSPHKSRLLLQLLTGNGVGGYAERQRAFDTR